MTTNRIMFSRNASSVLFHSIVLSSNPRILTDFTWGLDTPLDKTAKLHNLPVRSTRS